MSIYLDNAATTPLDERVFEAMKPFMLDKFGNPSSIHRHGRETRSAIEQARRQIADLLHAAPAEIFFTSGGTEADNTIIRNSIEKFGLKTAITSPIEHHAVLHTLEALEKSGKIQVLYVNLDDKGHVDYRHLEELLEAHPAAFVSLMHGNNEIGNLTDIAHVAELCTAHQTYFHSDTVQTMGRLPMNLDKLAIQAIAASAHKFHGPKGIGFMYLKSTRQIDPLIYGGGQERNMRGGTEYTYGIIGMAKALELAYSEMEAERSYIKNLKTYAVQQLQEHIDGIVFHGDCLNPELSLDKILSVGIPGIDDNDMLLFNLDIQGISVSGGSACSSGTNIGSHVLEALKVDANQGAVRISFSKYNTKEEIDFFVEKLAEIQGVSI